MDQPIVIDENDVVMIEDDDRDELVLLEQVPNLYSTHIFNNSSINNRASSVPEKKLPRESMHRSSPNGLGAPSYSNILPLIDLTHSQVPDNPIFQDIDQPREKSYSVSSSHTGPNVRNEEHISSPVWNITPGAGSTQETSRNSTSHSNFTHNRESSVTVLNERVTTPRKMSHTTTRKPRCSNVSLVSIPDDENGEGMNVARGTPLRADDNVILIQDNDDFEFKLESQLLQKPEFEFLRCASVDEKTNPQPKPKVVRPLRNPPITSPHFECRRYLHGKLDLRPMKTVELEDGDFIYIKHIVDIEPEDKYRSSLKTGNEPPITIRGLRLQRCKYLNGMLEKKMNEVCLCYEVDLDDSREPEEQSLVEVPLSSVKALRSLRWTNHNYPRFRNLNREAADDDKDAYDTGGLTVRWKYTCTYASALAREQNLYAERTLERITEDWLSSVLRTSHTYLTSNTHLREEWRGETSPGGSYVPECYEIEDDCDCMTEAQQLESSAVIEDALTRTEAFIIIDDDDITVSQSRESRQLGSDGSQIKRKSSFSSSSNSDSDQPDIQQSKRPRQDSDNSIEKIRQRLGRVSLTFDGLNYVKHTYNIGPPSETDSGSRSEEKSVSTRQARGRNNSARSLWLHRGAPPKASGRSISQRSALPIIRTSYPENFFSRAYSSIPSPEIPPQIDITTSELASPPPSGIIDLFPSSPNSRSSCLSPSSSSPTSSPPEPRRLAPGQTFTYGDAFCGAGGTTRGAVMAGLRVKWGFDFDHHACTTWRLNFPRATCYEMSSERFVALATPSPYSSYPPDDVKVDILHLSPPCQYFSPAHTVEGKNDEMNTASLFAVAAVIKVARPRVVTLEQTFGILYPRFRGYFHSLICMFTSCGFSLRWAIVPLAQWGLPQRRFRLIIIASCPGEPLPPMPPSTHSSPASPLPHTHPFATVHQTLLSIPHNAPNHAPHLLPEKYLRAYNAHAILPRTMTTSGGENWHPSGKRGFTDREFACLQGFPLEHRFGQLGVKRQIGNAVPPVVAKVLFEGIRAFMERGDGVLREGNGGEGSGDNDGDAALGDAMDICGEGGMVGVQIVSDEKDVEIIDLIGDTGEEVGKEGEEEDGLMDEGSDEIEFVRATKLEHIVID